MNVEFKIGHHKLSKVSLIGETIVANLSNGRCANKIRRSLVWRDDMALAVGLQLTDRTDSLLHAPMPALEAGGKEEKRKKLEVSSQVWASG